VRKNECMNAGKHHYVLQPVAGFLKNTLPKLNKLKTFYICKIVIIAIITGPGILTMNFLIFVTYIHF